MSEMISISADTLKNLEERVKKLAGEKSHLQLINHMLGKLSEAPGLDNTIENMLKTILDSVGGTNIIVYYLIDGTVYCADVFGKKRTLDSLDDTMLKRVLETGAVIEHEHDFRETLMKTPEFTSAWTWVFPLKVGSEIIGAIKMVNLHVGMRDLRAYLPVFFNYAALILKNEILGYTKLKKAYDEVNMANAGLEREIAERTMAEEALIREREFSRSLLESMADGVVACDAEGTLTLFNRSAREWHGMDPMRLPREEWAKHYNLYRSDGVTPLMTEEIPLARAFKGEIVVDAGMAIVARGRPPRFILANGSVIRDESGKKIGAVVVMRDVTELRGVEDKLRKANEELEKRVIERTAELHKANEDLQFELEERKRIEERLLVTQFSVDRSADVIFWIRPDGSYSYWNRAACELLGYSDDDFLRLRTFDLNPEHAGVVWQEHWTELKKCSFLRFETFLVRKDGSRIPVEITANHVEFNEQEYNCAFVRDITERKQAEEELHSLNEELEQRVQQRIAELKEKNDQLERMNKLFVGRELRMVELKERIAQLETATNRNTGAR
ncbi:MAG: hypothetical protein C0402_15990 [Thermodesulfovibrio sp.]|nr:hypothetical protein [Thermodesulfovibrio sp.]